MLKAGKTGMAVLCVFLFASTAFAGWRIHKITDLENKEKITLRIDSIFNGENGDVRMWFILAEKVKEGRLLRFPRYRVDRGPVHDLDLVPGARANHGADLWIRWRIWDCEGAISPELLEFMNGKSVVFQYYLPDGEIRETTFSLEGAKEAIQEVIRKPRP